MLCSVKLNRRILLTRNSKRYHLRRMKIATYCSHIGCSWVSIASTEFLWVDLFIVDKVILDKIYTLTKSKLIKIKVSSEQVSQKLTQKNALNTTTKMPRSKRILFLKKSKPIHPPSHRKNSTWWARFSCVYFINSLDAVDLD